MSHELFPHGNIPHDIQRQMVLTNGKSYLLNGSIHGYLSWTLPIKQTSRLYLDVKVRQHIYGVINGYLWRIPMPTS